MQCVADRSNSFPSPWHIPLATSRSKSSKGMEQVSEVWKSMSKSLSLFQFSQNVWFSSNSAKSPLRVVAILSPVLPARALPARCFCWVKWWQVCSAQAPQHRGNGMESLFQALIHTAVLFPSDPHCMELMPLTHKEIPECQLRFYYFYRVFYCFCFFSLVSEIEKTGVLLGLKKTNENNKGQEWGIATAFKKK